MLVCRESLFTGFASVTFLCCQISCFMTARPLPQFRFVVEITCRISKIVTFLSRAMPYFAHGSSSISILRCGERSQEWP